MRKIIKLRQRKEKPKKIRVAAYARVSRETDRTNHSLAAQVSYYSEHIQSNPDWEYAGVYIDSFVTGTKTSVREGFNELIADCEAGKIDLVLVKSISRSARNTVDLLNAVRCLKDIGVAVCFEKERINTLSSDGEFLLTVLASFAQEEITSMSNNIKWAFKRKFSREFLFITIRCWDTIGMARSLRLTKPKLKLCAECLTLIFRGAALQSWQGS